MLKTHQAARHPHRVVLFVYVGAVMALSGVQLLSPALPAVQEALGLSDPQVALFTSLFLLPSVVMALPIGLAADKWGRRIPFTVSLLVMGLGGLILFFIHDTTVLFAVRLVQGVAFAALLPTSITIIGDVMEGPALVRAQGRRSVALATGETIYPLIGGALVGLAWYAPFAVQVLGIPLAVLGWLWLGDAPREAGRKPVTVRDVGHMMANKFALSLQVAGFMRFMFKFAIWGYLPILFANRGIGTFTISMSLAVLSIVNVVSAWNADKVVRKVPVTVVAIGSLIGTAVGFIGVSLTSNIVLIFVFSIILGYVDGLYGVLQNAIVTVTVPREGRASFVAATGTVRNFGKFAGPTVMGLLLLLTSLDWVFVVIGVFALVMIPTSLPMRRADPELRKA